ncbi:hypothetical protein NX86_07260 [Streptococcus phocae subsp. salmonis]|nr:hypothetical protein NX86_07260 [Streptococcus phocae subsp. salmonis]
MAEKTDLSSAYRRLKSPNIKTKKRALKIIHEHKRYGKNKTLFISPNISQTKKIKTFPSVLIFF